MNRSRLSAAVYKRTGIVIDPGDPAFAVVEPNRLVIEEVASRVAERLETLPERIQSSAKALATEVAHQGVQRVVETLREARQTICIRQRGGAAADRRKDREGRGHRRSRSGSGDARRAALAT